MFEPELYFQIYHSFFLHGCQGRGDDESNPEEEVIYKRFNK